MMLKTWWRYRHLIAATVRHEFQAQYKKSILGPLWVIMNPLYMCIIYTAIFSTMMSSGEDSFSYTIYVATGLLIWSFFTDILIRSQAIYLSYSTLIKQQHFPLVCLPIVVIIMAMLDFVLSFGLFTGYLLATHSFPGWRYVALIPVLLIQAMYALGLGTLFGLLNLFFRDIGKGTVVLLQVWFWLTPIVYLQEKVPSHLQYGLWLNPLTGLMDASHAIMVYQQWPHWSTLCYPLGIAILIAVLGRRFYRRHMADLLDEF